MAISTNEIKDIMNSLSSFGLVESGGVTRLLYSKEWLDAQNSLKETFESIGMKTEFDAVGNLFGRVEGTDGTEDTIATGSHVDTVVNGGKLDGALGIFGGFLAVKYLLETYGKPKKNIEVISMAEEEGSRFPYVFWGSKNLLGLANKEDVVNLVDQDGIKFIDAMHECGFDFKPDNKSVLSHVKKFIEIHVEQGNFLEMEQKSVGIITGIVGQRRYNITLQGEANHAGTTLMEYRRDVMQVFAQIVNESIKKAKEAGNPLVLTFGKINVKPNTVNVVPGYAEFTIDCRHTDSQFLKDFTSIIEEDMKRIAKEANVEIEIDRWMDEEPVPMDKEVISVIEEACKEKNLNYKLMHSGAGHDAQVIAPKISTGMIFVPSVNGISHNPKEFTELEDLKQGIEALAETIYRLAY